MLAGIGGATAAAYAFVALASVTTAFQIALALGAPCGHLTWGGRFPGRLPGFMRAVALLSAVVLVAFGAIVSARAGIVALDIGSSESTLIWIVVGYSVLGVVANAATPSRAERRLWLPVVIGLLVSSLVVALSDR